MKSQIEALAADRSIELQWLENCTPEGVQVSSTAVHEFLSVLHKTEGLYFDHLSCLTGVDNGPEAKTMEVLYHLASLVYGFQLTVKTVLDRSNPECPTVSDIWKTADWHEREAFDLLGIKFVDHPDLRRILLPGDWEGYPLQKDYREPDKYHGINVAYEDSEQPSDGE